MIDFAILDDYARSCSEIRFWLLEAAAESGGRTLEAGDVYERYLTALAERADSPGRTARWKAFISWLDAFLDACDPENEATLRLQSIVLENEDLLLDAAAESIR